MYQMYNSIDVHEKGNMCRIQNITHTHIDVYIYISKIQVFVYNNMCAYCVYLLCVYIYTHMHLYIIKIFAGVYMHMDIYIIYIIYKYI